MNHGKNWKRLVEKVNSAYGDHIKRCSSDEEKGVLKETMAVGAVVEKKTKAVGVGAQNRVVECGSCGKIYSGPGMSRVIRQIKHHRCIRCGGKLRLAV